MTEFRPARVKGFYEKAVLSPLYRKNPPEGSLRRVKCLLSLMPIYSRGSRPRTGWFFSVSQFSSSSGSAVMVSSAM